MTLATKLNSTLGHARHIPIFLLPAFIHTHTLFIQIVSIHFIYHVNMDDKRAIEDREVWIVGSGTASLASALYLIKHTKVQPSKVHVLDKHTSLEEALYKTGNASSGYDQFAGCLPVPGGAPMEELLSMVPSTESPGRSLLQEIQTAEEKRLSASKNGRTSFLAQVNGHLEHLPIKTLNLSLRNRMTLVRFLLRREKTLAKRPIARFFPKRFFKSDFWAVWSAQ